MYDFNKLINMVKSRDVFTIEHGEYKYTLYFRYALTEFHGIFTQWAKIDKNASNDDVKELVFDVYGLYKYYLTQVSFFRHDNGEVAITTIPERDNNRFEEFLNAL